MQVVASLLSVIIFSIGNFVPLLGDDIFTSVVKIFVIASLFFLFLFGNKNKVKKIAVFYFLVITLLFVASSFLSMDIEYALDKYFSVSIVVITLFYLFSIIDDKKGFLEYAKLIVKAGLLVLLLTIIYKILFGFWNRGVRFFLNGSIVFAWLMSFYALLAFFIFNKIKSFFYLIAFFLFSLSVVWAESKGALISLILALIFYMVSDGKNHIKIPVLFLIVITIFFRDVIVSNLSLMLEGSRFSAILRVISSDVNSQDAGSITVRQDMLVESYGYFVDNWLSGIGLGNYQFYTVYGFPYPHNIHMEVFLECGLFVGLIYIIFLLASFVVSPKIIKSAIILFFIAGCFSGDITYLRFLLFICLLGLYLKLKKNSEFYNTYL